MPEALAIVCYDCARTPRSEPLFPGPCHHADFPGAGLETGIVGGCGRENSVVKLERSPAINLQAQRPAASALLEHPFLVALDESADTTEVRKLVAQARLLRSLCGIVVCTSARARARDMCK